MGAKNNDSLAEKQAIVKFYILEYRKCGNFNSKNDSRPCMGASAILKSVDFRAFAANVKTIAPTQKLYQSGHAIWWGAEPMAVRTFLEQHKMSGKTVVPFCTSGGSGISGSMDGIRQYAKGAAVKQGRDLTDAGQKAVTEWIRSIR